MSHITGKWTSTNDEARLTISTVDKRISASLWPNGLGRTSETNTVDVIYGWETVPETFDGIRRWAYMADVHRTERTGARTRTLVYDPEMTPDESTFAVTIIAQGFLGSFNISPLGNWNGKEAHAPAAVQFLTLEAGGCTEAFGAQTSAIKMIQELVSLSTGADEEDHENPSELLFRRRVFTKVRPIHGRQRNYLKVEDDPKGRARKIASRWEVDHVIKTGVRRPDGGNINANYKVLRVGDFVEVAFGVSAISYRRGSESLTETQLVIQEVVKLWSVRDVQSIYQRANADEHVEIQTTSSVFGLVDEEDMEDRHYGNRDRPSKSDIDLD